MPKLSMGGDGDADVDADTDADAVTWGDYEPVNFTQVYEVAPGKEYAHPAAGPTQTMLPSASRKLPVMSIKKSINVQIPHIPNVTNCTTPMPTCPVMNR